MADRRVYETAFFVGIDDSDESLELARQGAHDQVIINTGRARRSGVTWSHYQPASDAQRQLTAEGSDIVLPLAAQLIVLAYPLGVLVLATVEVDPDAAV